MRFANITDIADPARYTVMKSTTEDPAQEKHQGEKITPNKSAYTCPMHTEIRQDGPGNCPKCGMTLEPIVAVVTAEQLEYSCPLHPEVISDKPGNCPKCGMALEPRGDQPSGGYA